MTANSRSHEELLDHLESVLAERITQQQFDRVQTLVLSDAQLCETYVRFMYVQALAEFSESSAPHNVDQLDGSASAGGLLDAACGSETSITRGAADAAPPASFLLGFLASSLRQVPGGEFIVGCLLLAAVSGAIAGLIIYHARPAAHEPAAALADWQLPRSQRTLVDSKAPAQVTRSADGVWTGDELRRPERTASMALQLDQIQDVSEGVIEVTFASGARITVEAPARFALRSPSECELARGRLVALVPAAAVGFTVRTPSAAIVDLGTEFGVDVDHRGDGIVVVFRGEVRVEPGKDLSAGKPAMPLPVVPLRLKAGQASRIAGGAVTVLREPPSDVAPFVRDVAHFRSPPTTASVIANGSFELPQIAGQYESATTDHWILKDAHVTSSAVLESVHQGAATAEDGQQFLTLNAGGVAGSISQTFATIADRTYTVSFAHNQFYDGIGGNALQPDSVSLTARVEIGSDFVLTKEYVYRRGNLHNRYATDATWEVHTFTFVATASSATLSFISNTAAAWDYGQLVDNVIVSEAGTPPAESPRQEKDPD